MTSYKIQITNESGDEASYFLACNTPAISGLASAATVWSTVLVSRTAVQANNIAILDIPSSQSLTYVICGTSPDTPLSDGLAVDFSEASPMASAVNNSFTSAGSQIFHVAFQDGDVNFSKAAETTGAPGLWCTVDTDPYIFSSAMNVFAGLAIAMPSSEDILPTVIWTVRPNSTYSVAGPPAPSFKLGVGSNAPGTLVSLQDSSSSQLASIDFSTAVGHLCHVVHQANGLIKCETASTVISTRSSG